MGIRGKKQIDLVIEACIAILLKVSVLEDLQTRV